MTNEHNNVPEPDQTKKDKPEQPVVNQVVELYASGSENDSEDEAYNTDVHGYQPLTLSENDDGISEFHAEQMDSSDDESVEGIAEQQIQEKREMAINTDLVLNTMRGVSLPSTNIPAWADKLSENEWNSMIQRTITGNKSVNENSGKDNCDR